MLIVGLGSSRRWHDRKRRTCSAGARRFKHLVAGSDNTRGVESILSFQRFVPDTPSLALKNN